MYEGSKTCFQEASWAVCSSRISVARIHHEWVLHICIRHIWVLNLCIRHACVLHMCVRHVWVLYICIRQIWALNTCGRHVCVCTYPSCMSVAHVCLSCNSIHIPCESQVDEGPDNEESNRQLICTQRFENCGVKSFVLRSYRFLSTSKINKLLLF